MSIKISRALNRANIHHGPVTESAILSAIPAELIDELPSRLITKVIEALNTHWHNARASTGAEKIDSNCVWVSGLNRSIEWDITPTGAANPRFF